MDEDERHTALHKHGWTASADSPDLFRNPRFPDDRIVIAEGTHGWLHYSGDGEAEMLVGHSRYQVTLTTHLKAFAQKAAAEA